MAMTSVVPDRGPIRRYAKRAVAPSTYSVSMRSARKVVVVIALIGLSPAARAGQTAAEAGTVRWAALR
jgi:hypothetical protein